LRRHPGLVKKDVETAEYAEEAKTKEQAIAGSSKKIVTPAEEWGTMTSNLFT